jgi:RimJ/RimL family protein N-acetyltransferase
LSSETEPRRCPCTKSRPRLWLRWPRPEDAEILAEIAALAVCQRGEARWPFDWDGRAVSLPEFVARLRSANAAGNALMLGIAEKSDPGKLIGAVGIDAPRTGVATLGFMLDVRRQGYGLMTEAVRALVSATFMYSRINRIRAAAGMSGLGVRRVLEKSGFQPVSSREPGLLLCSHLEVQRDGSRPERIREPVSGEKPAGERVGEACAA